MKSIIFAALFVFSCQVPQPTIPPTDVNPPVVVPPVVPDTGYSCRTACDNLKFLGCEEGEPLLTRHNCNFDADCESGQYCSTGQCVVSCITFCEETQDQGVSLSVACATNINSCEELNDCR